MPKGGVSIQRWQSGKHLCVWHVKGAGGPSGPSAGKVTPRGEGHCNSAQVASPATGSLSGHSQVPVKD